MDEPVQTPRFFYLIPAQTRGRLDGESFGRHMKRLLFSGKRQLPSGGVKIIYQHCELLRQHGIVATPVHMADFIVDWFPHQVPHLTLKQAQDEIGPDDVLVCPEVIPAAAASFTNRHKIAFIQNWAFAAVGTGADRRFEDFAMSGLLACSNYIRDYMQERSDLDCAVITNGIDLEIFKPPLPGGTRSRIIYQNRRNVADARRALELLDPALRARHDFFEMANNYPQAEMVRFFQEADIYLAIGYPEGFALPPLEAMACGCAVVGFTGGGGLEHMLDGETALVAPDGDARALADGLTRLLTDDALKEQLRAGGLRKAAEYPLARMERELLAWAGSFGAVPQGKSS